MSNTWVVADPHLGHKGVCNFLRQGDASACTALSKLRPWDHPDQMDAALIQNWNARVNDADRVYVLGDVVINRRCLPTLALLKGRKVLVKGNHDIFKLKDYMPYFDDIRAYVVGHHVPAAGLKRKYIMSHIPVHPGSLGRYGINIHGHLHDGVVDDPRYVCVSMEQTDFAPIPLSEALTRAGSL